MSGLVLKLGPKERVLINGAVIENGDRRSRLSIVTRDAHILRLKDAIHPDEATTPVRRFCFAVQLVLTGDDAGDDTQHGLTERLEELSQVFQDPDSRLVLEEASEALLAKQYYRLLKTMRRLLPREDRLLSIRKH